MISLTVFDDIESYWKFFPKFCNLKVDDMFEINFSCNYISHGGSLLPASCYNRCEVQHSHNQST